MADRVKRQTKRMFLEIPSQRHAQLGEIVEWQQARSYSEVVCNAIDDQHRLLRRAREGCRIVALDRASGAVVEDIIFLRGVP